MEAKLASCYFCERGLDSLSLLPSLAVRPFPCMNTNGASGATKKGAERKKEQFKGEMGRVPDLPISQAIRVV